MSNQVHLSNQQKDTIVNSITDGLKEVIRSAVSRYLDSLSVETSPVANNRGSGQSAGFKLPKGD